uniref:Ig-like domain-containing protein n=1 Tax=Xiphophorus maculatus TaxID=8083 RepID=A0A3B5Q556_XIPMA
MFCVSAVQSQRTWAVIYSHTQICAVEGSSVTISCRFSSPTRGNQDALLETLWFLNDRPVDLRSDLDSRGRVQTLCGPTACALTLTDLRESDSGRYRFWFRTNCGSYSGSPGVSLTVTGDFSLTPLQVKVLKSEQRESFTRADLQCLSSCRPDHQSYIWIRNRREILKETSPSVSVSVHPADTYSCSLKGNQEFPSPSVYPPLPPSVSVSPSAEVEEGSSVTLTCSSDANPAASYSWYKDSITSSPSKDSQLVFSSIQSSDSGRFICKAENQLGWKWSEFKLIDVKYPPLPPSVSVSPSAEVEEGSSVTLTCSSDANPAASYSWYKEDEESPKASGQSFTITDVRPAHSGNYSCKAENIRGSQSSTVHLEVKGHLQLPVVSPEPEQNSDPNGLNVM